MASQAADLFVSYKAEDRARVKLLVEALQSERFRVWWDAQIGGGANWHEEIDDHLQSAKCVIVVWSKRSVGPEGHFVRDEARRAQRRGVYLPVCIDAVEPPLGFGEIQALSLKGWKGDPSDPRFRHVANAVSERLTGERTISWPESKHGVSRRAVLASGLAIGTVGVAAGGSWLFLRSTGADAKRIAVLPFANLSGDPSQSYFSEGIAEELRSALARIGMQVIGRTSSDAVKDLDAKAAAAKLGVPNILTGSVRRSPNTIRIDAQLVGGSDGVERWAQSYDRAPGDEIKIQTDIAQNVADALQIALGSAGQQALSLSGTADSEAQDLVLQSRNLWRQATGPQMLQQCIALADAAIARDQNYADAYVQRAFSLYGLATNFTADPGEVAAQMAMAADAANRALSIAPKLGSAHVALAVVNTGRIDFPDALTQFRQALALSPNDTDVLAFATTSLPYFGDGQEALDLANRFIAVDPLNGVAYRRKAEVLYVLGRYQQSVDAAHKALQIAPDAYTARVMSAYSLILMSRPREALAEIAAMPSDDPFRIALEAIIAARTGDRAGAERAMQRLKKQAGATASFQYAQIQAQLGQKDAAFAELNEALAVKDGGLIYLKTDRFLDPLRDDPRYAALVQKVGFP